MSPSTNLPDVPQNSVSAPMGEEDGMSHASPSPTPDLSNLSHKSRRRWLRISIRVMMVAVLITGVLLSWPIRRANVQRRAVAALRKADSRVILLYDFQYGKDGRFKPNASPPAPTWLRRLIGDEFFQDVDSVTLQGPIDEVTLALLGEFEKLRILHVFDSSKIGEGLVHLRGLRNLQRLDLRGPGITDAGLANIRGLEAIRHLKLEDTSVTDAGLAHLAALTGLQSIGLVGKQGTAAGLTSRGITRATDAGLVHLSGLHHLSQLEISAAPGVTDLKPLDLKRNLPKLI